MRNKFTFILLFFVTWPAFAEEIMRATNGIGNMMQSITISENSNFYATPGSYTIRIPPDANIVKGNSLNFKLLVEDVEKYMYFPVTEIIYKKGVCMLMSESGYRNKKY